MLPIPDDWTGKWVIGCTAARFVDIRSKPKFHRLIEVARFANVFRFTMGAFRREAGSGGPSETRNAYGALFYDSGTLYEAIRHIPKLRPDYGESAAWEEGFARFGSDEDIRNETKQGSKLHILRNRASFHALGSEVVERSLRSLPVTETVTFASAIGTDGKEFHYDLADLVGIHFAVGCPSVQSEMGDEFTDAATYVRDRVLQYLRAAEVLFRDGLDDLGFETLLVRGASGL